MDLLFMISLIHRAKFYYSRKHLERGVIEFVGLVYLQYDSRNVLSDMLRVGVEFLV
jgi:hypothetical protein